MATRPHNIYHPPAGGGEKTNMQGNSDMVRLATNWPARIMTQERKTFDVTISEARPGAVCISSTLSWPENTVINIEFFVPYNNENCRIRAKTQVKTSQNDRSRGVVNTELKIMRCSSKEIHTYNNVLASMMH